MAFSYEEVRDRHHIHQHPELFTIFQTNWPSKRVASKELGIRILESGLKTGLIAEIGSADWWHWADIDALPILEQTNLSYQSQNLCHACLWPWFSSNQSSRAAAILKEKEDQLEGIAWSFSQAEEISEGASDVLATGLLEDVWIIITTFLS